MRRGKSCPAAAKPCLLLHVQAIVLDFFPLVFWSRWYPLLIVYLSPCNEYRLQWTMDET